MQLNNFPYFDIFAFRIGIFVSTHPWKTILISVIITGLFCIGAGVNFTETNDNSVIWVPADSDFLAHKRYVESVYPSTTRFFYLIFVSSNVMSAATTQKVNQIIDVYTYKLCQKNFVRNSKCYSHLPYQLILI